MARDLKRIPHQLDPKAGTCRAVIESPSGRRSKFAYDAEADAFVLKMILPAGMSFPLDFGFIPSTKAEDGDPADVLILSDEPGEVGTIVEVRLVGVVESKHYEHVKSLDQLGDRFVDQLGQFFIQYNRLRGRGFEVQAVKDGASAAELVKRHSL